MNEQLNGTVVFLVIFPQIERHALFAFRGVKDPGRFDDCVQETLAICWLWCCRLWEKGKDAREFPTTLAGYATRQVRSGRRFAGGKLGLKDALNPVAHATQGFTTQSLPEHQSTAAPAPWMEQLVDQPGSRVAELAAFRIDFPEWLATLSGRNRGIAEDMAVGDTTQEVSGRYQVSPGRVSQLRREFRDDWLAFTGGRA
jgi:hypothetical protein